MLSYHNCHIYRTWKSIYVGGKGDFEVIIKGGGGQATRQRDKTIFMEEVYPSRNHVNILIWQLEEN